MTAVWIQSDGTPVSCAEKLRVLEENRAELAQMMQDAFDDAILMDVDETRLRETFAAMVAALTSPRMSA